MIVDGRTYHTALLTFERRASGVMEINTDPPATKVVNTNARFHAVADPAISWGEVVGRGWAVPCQSTQCPSTTSGERCVLDTVDHPQSVLAFKGQVVVLYHQTRTLFWSTPKEPDAASDD